MDRDHDHRRNAGAEDMANDERQTIPKFIYDFSRASRCRKNKNYYVWEEVPRGVTRVSYCTDLDEDGVPCRCFISCKAYNYMLTRTSNRVQLDDDLGGRMDRFHARLRRRTRRWVDYLLRRSRPL